MSEEQKPESAENFFVQDRGERAIYMAADPTAEVYLPMTRDGYEAMLERCANLFSPPLPRTDAMRTIVSGYVHHITNDKCTTTLKEVSSYMYKSISNALTWTIDQEIKKKRQDEFEKAKLEAKLADEERAKAEAEEKRKRKAEARGKLKVAQQE